jgi:hypothetical protein
MNIVIYRFLADFVVLCHLTFILFAIFGGFLVLRWRKVVWFHIPAALWAALIEFTGWFCPLTPLENLLRMKGGGAAYSDGFIEHYLLPVIYPVDLTREIQIFLGALVIATNLLIYWYIFMYRRKRLTTS